VSSAWCARSGQLGLIVYFSEHSSFTACSAISTLIVENSCFGRCGDELLEVIDGCLQYGQRFLKLERLPILEHLDGNDGIRVRKVVAQYQVSLARIFSKLLGVAACSAIFITPSNLPGGAMAFI